MIGSIKEKMAESVDDAECIVVFTTKNYIHKSSGADRHDNCNLHFEHSYGLQWFGPIK